jgi:8-oxo-dGTP pyrophosphatase MutT (NUDIX family)
MAQGIDVTVAAIVPRAQRFLVVEERVGGALVLNQPAGHLEPGESLIDAVVRETREETGYRFEPSAVVGIYLWHNADSGATFLRVAFCGSAEPPAVAARLDEGIVGVHWMTHRQIAGRERDLRSPMVMRCLDDYLAERRYPLDCVNYLEPAVAARLRAARR